MPGSGLRRGDASFVYVPFNKDQTLLDDGQRIARANGQPDCLTPKSDLKKATAIYSSYRLTILAHGGLYHPVLYSASASGSTKIFPDELAKQLVAQGLTTKCTHIDVFACNAGAQPTEEKKKELKKFKDPRGNRLDNGFVTLLKEAFKKRHLDIEVEGYSTTVADSDKGQIVDAQLTGRGRHAHVHGSRQH